MKTMMQESLSDFFGEFFRILQKYYLEDSHNNITFSNRLISIAVSSVISKVNLNKIYNTLKIALMSIDTEPKSQELTCQLQKETLDSFEEILDDLNLDSKDKEKILPSEEISSLRIKNTWTRDHRLAVIAILLQIISLLMQIFNTPNNTNTTTYNVTINNYTINQESDDSDTMEQLQDIIDEMNNTIKSLIEDSEMIDDSSQNDESSDNLVDENSDNITEN